MKYIVIIAGLLIVLLHGCSGCKEELKPTIPISLCDTLKPLSANFKVGFYEDTGSGNQFLEGDTFSGGQIYFKATDPTARLYEWNIGTETEPRTGKSILVYFPNQTPGPLTARLKVERFGDTCFLPENQMKVIEKQIRFISYREAAKFFEGNYTGYIVGNPKDTFTIRCFWTDQIVNDVEPAFGGSVWLEYYLPGCSKKHYMTIGINYIYSLANEQVGGNYAAGQEYQGGILQSDCSNGARTISGPYVFLSPGNHREINIKVKIKRPQESQNSIFHIKGLKR